MESTLCVLELFNHHGLETINTQSLQHFLKPFHQMVEYQLSCNL